MKAVVFLVNSVFIFTNMYASEKSLLTTWAIFRTTHVKADTVDCDEKYSKEEMFSPYQGRPVCEKIALGSRGTPAIRTLIGFLGKDGIRYACKSFPYLQKDETLVLVKFDDNTKSFLMRKETNKRCWCCAFGRELVCFETGCVESEET